MSTAEAQSVAPLGVIETRVFCPECQRFLAALWTRNEEVIIRLRCNGCRRHRVVSLYRGSAKLIA